MNRLIIGTLMVIGVLWGVGVGQTLDPRLILPNSKEWGESDKPGCVKRVSFFRDGTFIDRGVCNGAINHEIVGTWYTLGSELFQRYALVSNTPETYISDYHFSGDSLKISLTPVLTPHDRVK